MELIVITTVLCITLSILIAPCASFHIQVHSSHEQVHDLQLSLAELPRKLRPTIQERIVKGYEGKDFKPDSKQKGALSGMMHGRGETMQEWMERRDSWKYFTMDYTPVRRRRPIHNKAVPVGP
ncbi:hypothetical protein HHK36_029879 [Tetracentron sinense]|uniref:Uncharacterized protein n=1 Tax=Tetracentron sinense TaxID=13715 RepID=A0A835D258_TETSI|nr:hypothetical protein HHK36_029879 [Tetracentron sinense]